MAGHRARHCVEGFCRSQRRLRRPAEARGESARHRMSAVQEIDAATDVPRAGVLGMVQGVLDRINDLMAGLSSLAIGAAGGVLTWEVAGRYFLAIPRDWQGELSALPPIGAPLPPAPRPPARP